MLGLFAFQVKAHLIASTFSNIICFKLSLSRDQDGQMIYIIEFSNFTSRHHTVFLVIFISKI